MKRMLVKRDVSPEMSELFLLTSEHLQLYPTQSGNGSHTSEQRQEDTIQRIINTFPCSANNEAIRKGRSLSGHERKRNQPEDERKDIE